MRLSATRLTAIASAAKRLFSPINLFAAGEQGVWYDPSDFSTMFQDAAGTTPVTAVEQPVGRILDKSGRGNHATQATVPKRPILKIDANGKYYLKFDGVDDALATASINFTGTDKMTVVAGVRKLSDAARGVIVELENGAAGGFGISANGLGTQSYRFFSISSTGATSVEPTGFISPITNVLTAQNSIPGDLLVFRGNAVQVAQAITDQGTGNYGNWPLYIGSRGGTGIPFNGHLYSLLIRGAQSTDAQIASAETYVNSKTGAY